MATTECPAKRARCFLGCFSGVLWGEGACFVVSWKRARCFLGCCGGEGLLRGQLGELCAAIPQNNPTCFNLTWGFAFERCPKPS